MHSGAVGGILKVANIEIGQRFGRLVVQSRAPEGCLNGYIGAIWNCLCDCGNPTVSASNNLLSGRKVSCGCILSEGVRARRFASREDLTGRVFGVLTVLSLLNKVDKKGRFSFWECGCVCGAVRFVTRTSLLSGKHARCLCGKKATSLSRAMFDPVLVPFVPKARTCKHPIGVFFGRHKNKKGYIEGKVWDGEKLRRLKEHTFVMEQVLGRRLLKGEEVHHLNEVTDDNRPENLQLFGSSSEHIRTAHAVRRK